MNYLRRFVLGVLVLFSSLANAASASFDLSTNMLTLPDVFLIDRSATYTNVVVHLLDFGTLAFDDTSVGNNITYQSSTNTLRIPMVTMD